MKLDIDFHKLILSNGMTIEQTLQAEAQRFVQILREEITRWYATYSPIMYGRTFGMLSSIYADAVQVDIDSQHFRININYSGSAFSPGLWGSGANKLLLMNSGYAVGKDVWFKDIPNFGYRSGGHFLESALARFNASNSLGVQVTSNF